MRPALLLVTLLAAASLASAQQFVDIVERTAVEVPVTVRGSDGSALRDLTRENFELLVDGNKVTVDSFEAAGRAPAVAHRNFLLLFDVAGSQPGTIARAKEAARTLIESQLRDGDVAAVATFTAEQGARMVTAFTRNKALLLGAIDTLGDAQHFKVMDPLLLSANYTASASAPATVPSASQQQLSVEEQRARIRTRLQNFAAVARALDPLKGQKQVILLSEGFDASLLPQGTPEEEAQGISAMAELFRRSDVRLHAIDLRDGVAATANDALPLMTRPTGGTVFGSTNELKSQFDRLLAPPEAVYLLRFKVPAQKRGQFHPVRVNLVNAKGEVTHRAGYYDRGNNISNIEATLRFSELLTTQTEVGDVPLSVTAFAAPGEDDSARVPVIVDAAGTTLLDKVDGNAVHANIFVYAFDAKGEAVDFLQQRVALDLAKTGEAMRATGLRYVGGLRLPPGDYSVKALVRVDESGRIGLSTTNVHVPKYDPVAVLPVGMGDMGKWITVVSPLRGSDATALLTLDRPFFPRLTAAPPIDIALLVRGLTKEDFTITPSLVGADGRSHKISLHLAARTEPDAHGVTKLLVRMPAQTLAKGNYELRFALPGGSVARLPVAIP